MKINYGINRKITGKRLQHENHSFNLNGSWDDEEFHDRIRDEIKRKHPGWSITGYAYETETRVYEIKMPAGVYLLSSSTLEKLIAADSRSLSEEDIQVREVTHDLARSED